MSRSWASHSPQTRANTSVGSGEAEGSEDDATEDPIVLESGENKREADLSLGGCGSSSLRECIELLNQAKHNSPAASHSGPKLEKETGPPQVMSPNVEEDRQLQSKFLLR